MSAPEEATRLLTKEAPALEKLGRYQIVRSLGAGGMGQVYLGLDEQLNRPVAVKLLSDYHAAEEERMRRFRQEALSASALNHPNILTIYEIGESDGANFIATEFVDGLTLSERLGRGGISIEETLNIAQQIASALSAAHAAGIIHRDIKSANIMVRADGLVKVLDFGIAKYEQPENETDTKKALVETMPGAVMGTSAYMSPEQARGLLVDVRTDIWSLGVVFYEMIAGRRPFVGDTVMDVMSAVLERQPAPLSTTGAAAPEPLERIVFRALSKDREARYASANEMLADLKDLSKKLAFAAETERQSAEHKPLTSAPAREIGGSIAVLPFVNMSSEPENDYFCDGLAEELLNALTRINDLKVAPRTSSFSFKGKNANVSAIGEALKVNSVLEGSVRKSANRLRIGVQLINVADGYNLWSEQYDRELKDIFDVQDEIALAVVDALKVTLLGREKAAVLKRSTDNVEAYQLLLKGRYHWYKQLPESVRKSREYFQQAIELDPAYAPGYAGLSEFYGLSSALGMMPPAAGWPLAEAAMMKAQELDDSLPEVHNGLAAIRMFYYRDWQEAQREIKRTIELNPKFAEVHCLHSYCLVAMGRLDEAVAEARRACELDPLSTTYNRYLGKCFYFARQYDQAIAGFQQALELDASNAPVHADLGQVFHLAGYHRQAIAEYQKALELVGEVEAAAALASIYASDGFEPAVRTAAEKELEQLKVKLDQGEYVPAIRLAHAYTTLDQTEHALIWLEKACEERNVFPLLIHVDPFYDRLRGDARFTDLLERFSLAG